MKKKRLISNMGWICLVSIVSINLIGVGYGMWSDNLNIETDIATGNIDPMFELDNNTEIIYENGEITLNIIDNGKTATVTGWCYNEPSEYREIFIGVSDSPASIPTVFDSQLNSNDGDEAIIISESGNGIRLIIGGSEIGAEETIRIDRDIAFRAFNQAESKGWIEFLNLRGSIEVRDRGITEEKIEDEKEERTEMKEKPNIEEKIEEDETPKRDKIEAEVEENQGFKIEEQSESVQFDNDTRLEGE